jgi:outer membrane receptor protein involved in Fe transport
LTAVTIAAFSVGPVSAATASNAATTVAQAGQTGTITGKVVDGAGKPLSGARIGIAGPKATETTTKPDGTYHVDVPPGIYRVTIAAAGFQSTEQDTVVVISGGSVALATTLIPASLTTIASVSVSSSTSLSDSATSVAQFTVPTIRSQGQDQVVNLLDQLPGVEVLRVGGGSNEPGANASISIRGAQPYESQILIDGHPVNTIGNGAYGFNTTFVNSILLGGVEASKGPGSMPNTVTDAVGGTVNFQTASITAKPSGELMTQEDSFGGWTYGVRFSDTIGKFGFLVGVARETTPGYMNPQYIFGFGRASFFSPYTSPTYPLTGNNQVYPSGTSYVGVLNYNYMATSDFSSNAQLFKLAYNFSPVTSIQLSSYSTQTWLDETGNNVGNIYATIVPCITNGLGPGTAPAGPTCAAGTSPYDENYTATPFLGYVGKTVPINLYAGYPNTFETDNEPIFTADLRTVIGPGTFLARFYGGSITRDIIQNTATGAIGPCYSPACPWVGSSPALSTDAGNNFAADNGYAGEPYYELTTDTLHGSDVQYSLPFGSDGDSLTLGFDSHSDSFNYTEAYSNGWFWYGNGTASSPYGGCGYPGQTAAQIFACAYTVGYYPQPHIAVRSTTENLRGTYLITPKLQLEFGGYLSNTTYVGSRFDPRGGLTWRPNSKLSVRASAGSAYVTPYAGLINPTPYISRSTFFPASQFSAETSMGYDVGADYKFNRDSLVSVDFYSTNIYNRYATVNVVTSGTYNGTPYTSEVIPTSQGQSLNQGFELSLLHQPKVGFGYHAAIDLLRDYFYDQTNVALNNFGGVFLGPLPDNGVQLPGYPFNKMRGDVWYQFADGKNIRISATTYGANNAFGQPGFTVVDGAIKLPVTSSFDVTLGASNILNKDNYATGGIYFGGYTYQALGGGVGPTNWEYATPQTVYLQLSKAINW